MKNIFGKILQTVLLPLFIAGAFFTWSLPRITTDYNFNTDEILYLQRSVYGYAYFSGNFGNKIWSEWGSYDQPQLTNFVYSLIPGDHSVVENSNSPCPTRSDNFNDTWSCLAGKPLTEWPTGSQAVQKLITRARTFALAISAGVIATVYYVGLLATGPVAGIAGALWLGWYSFFRNLSTMVMMDQILLVLLNLQLIASLLIIKKKNLSYWSASIVGLLSGLSLATKFNAVPSLGLAYMAIVVASIHNKTPQWLAKLTLSAIIAATLFLGLNPYLWDSPFANFQTMVQWRLEQARSQADYQLENTVASTQDAAKYALTEITNSWDHQPTLLMPLIVIALLGFISLVIKNPALAVYTAGTLITLLFYVPLKWNRYLMPAMPSVAVLIGTGVVSLTQLKKIKKSHILGILGLGIVIAIGYVITSSLTPAESFVTLLSLLLTAQGGLVTTAMLYGFTHDEEKDKSRIDSGEMKKFSLIIPVRNEESVIGDTLTAMSIIDYPKDKYEVLIPVRADDQKTQAVVNKTIAQLSTPNMRTIIIDGDANTKPYSLNIGLHYSKGEYVGVFDAEDEPHADLLKRINEKFAEDPTISAVQAPVQLINLHSNWYSTLSCLEYYFWFQSVLPFLSKLGTTPLGGNTIFIKSEVMRKLGGWDEKCLTEDAEIGLRLGSEGYKIGIVTDYHLATLEETPHDEFGIIKQRARWDQGYLQVLRKGTWRQMSGRQQLLALYTLTQPIFRHVAFLNMFIAPVMSLFLHVSTGVALLSFIPTYFLLMQWGMYLLALHDIGHKYKIKVGIGRYITTILYFYPYQALLSLSSFRALNKLISGSNVWDKTEHYNAHRLSYT